MIKIGESGSSGHKRGGSASPPLARKPGGVGAAAAPSPPPPTAYHHINKDIPPELQGVSVKELVKVIGESRANGNGVTPPGTPVTLRRAGAGGSSRFVTTSLKRLGFYSFYPY